jgi:DNA-binding NarL/FixJ family response regulator
MRVVGEAGDGRTAIACTEALLPDVIVLDVSMPTMNGLEATRALREAAPSTAVVALTRYNDDAYVRELLGAGALGYVLKQSPSSELLHAIRAAAAGLRYLDSDLSVPFAPIRRDGHVAVLPQVSSREREVLRLTALGESNKEIATALNISVKTVEAHKANGMRKLDLHGRIDVVRYAALQGWLSDI